jgi:ATP-dependent Lon protease
VDESRTPRIPEELSILPVRGFVVFPGTVLPLNVQRAASLKLLDETLPRTKVIGLLTQRDETKEDPSPQDLYSVGTAALVLKLVRQSEDNVLVIVQGLRRFRCANHRDRSVSARRSRSTAIDPAAAEQGMGSYLPEFA